MRRFNPFRDRAAAGTLAYSQYIGIPWPPDQKNVREEERNIPEHVRPESWAVDLSLPRISGVVA
jgi:hypothetical protein